MSEKMVLDDPKHFGIMAAKLAEGASDRGVSDRTLSIHRFLMTTCAVVTAVMLGVCSVSTLDLQIGQVALASGGWLTLALTLMVCYVAFAYFTHYLQDRSLYGFQKARSLLEGQLLALGESAASHFQILASRKLTPEEGLRESELGDAKNEVMRSVANHLTTYRVLHMVTYGFLPACMVAIALVAIVTQGSWQFSTLPPMCVST